MLLSAALMQVAAAPRVAARLEAPAAGVLARRRQAPGLLPVEAASSFRARLEEHSREIASQRRAGTGRQQVHDLGQRLGVQRVPVQRGLQQRSDAAKRPETAVRRAGSDRADKARRPEPVARLAGPERGPAGGRKQDRARTPSGAEETAAPSVDTRIAAANSGSFETRAARRPGGQHPTQAGQGSGSSSGISDTDPAEGSGDPLVAPQGLGVSEAGSSGRSRVLSRGLQFDGLGSSMAFADSGRAGADPGLAGA
jgi:hypothetical protein